MNREERLKYLDTYFNNINSSKHLLYNEAKVMYLDMLNINNITEKKKIREDIINGTLYKVYEFSKNLIDIFNVNYVGFEDLVNDIILLYIEAIDNGELLSNDSFSPLFCRNIYIRLNAKYNELGFNRSKVYEDFVDMFVWYVKEINVNGIVSFNKFSSYCMNLDSNIINYDICYLYSIIKDFYEELELAGNLNVGTLEYVKKFRGLIVSYLMSNHVDTYNYKTDEIDIMLNDMLKPDIRKVMNRFNERKKKVLYKKLGFECERETILEIAKDLGISKCNVSLKYSSALELINKRYGKELKELRLLYDGCKEIN